jgi:orotate phosphoribosyltransferase
MEEPVDHPGERDAAIYEYLRADRLLVDGHFAFRSGRHSTALLDRDRLLADPGAASRMGYALAKHFFTSHIETVAAPSIWGAGLAQWVAYFLEPRAKVVYATPKDGVPTIAGNLHDLISGRRVLLVDNLVISGETIARFAELLVGHDGDVIGLGTLWNSSDPVIAGHVVFGLLNAGIEAYTPDTCPRCSGPEPTDPTAVPY